MDRLLEICDEMASGSEYVKFKAIMERYYGKVITKNDGDKNYARLRKRLNRIPHVVEYENGCDFKNGFRYKKGFEYYFRNEEEKNELKKREGDEKQLFLTGGLQMLFDGESSKDHLVELECVLELPNLGLVKVLVKKYVGKRVISFRYQKGFENMMDITMHPHLLKEYNSRWFLFGYVVEDHISKVVNFALDRIVYRNPSDIRVHSDIDFLKAPRNFYQQYFKDIVGVTRPEGGSIEAITIQTLDFKVHHLLRTKPIHPSQQETKPFENETGKGEFILQVIPNIELQTKILSFGDNIRVIGGEILKQQISEAIANMSNLYKSDLTIRV